jgi:hypothetical protein
MRTETQLQERVWAVKLQLETAVKNNDKDLILRFKVAFSTLKWVEGLPDSDAWRIADSFTNEESELK